MSVVNMSVLISILIACFGTLSALNVESNVNGKFPRNHYQNRRSVFPHFNDLNENNRRMPRIYPTLNMISDNWGDEGNSNIHEPREDPRLFYQSELYYNKMNSRLNARNEVSEIYPGNDVVLSSNDYYQNSPSPLPISRSLRKMSLTGDGICIKCPADRTLIAQGSYNAVKFKPPRLKTCLGTPAPKGVQFVIMYGPSYGSYIEEGIHKAMGHITYQNKILEYCAMNVKVLVKKCQIPRYLVADCDQHNKSCVFACRDVRTVLQGQNKLECIDNKWSGNLPHCKARKQCRYPTPPQHGRLSCKSINRSSLREGAKCRVRCAEGWRPSLRSFSVCRHGSWTHNLTCIPKNT